MSSLTVSTQFLDISLTMLETFLQEPLPTDQKLIAALLAIVSIKISEVFGTQLYDRWLKCLDKFDCPRQPEPVVTTGALTPTA